MMVLRLFCALVVLSFSRNTVLAQTYSCPGLSANPVVIPAASGSSFTRQINKSASNTVCVILRITPKTQNANMNKIERSSSNDDYYIVPVARSYNSNNWERVAGPYATELSISNCCSLSIPNLSSVSSSDNGKFILMSFSHSASNKEEVSRFFQQTTFGPDMNMINSWNYGGVMTREMGKWLKSQMDKDETPITSHRAFFRQRANFPLPNALAMQFRRPRHPCARYARWREYSFTPDEYLTLLNVSRWNGQYLLRVDGVPRTVVSTWKEEEEGQNLPLGDFEFCYGTDGMVNGEVWISQNNNNCYMIYNPPINLPNGVITNAFQAVTLPSKSSFTTVDPVAIQDGAYRLYGEGIYANSAFNTAGCSDIDDDGIYSYVLGTFSNGNQALYDGHAQLDNNTLENPIADGGAAMMSVTVIAYEEREAMDPYCPVAVRSFLNSDSCYLAQTSTKTCSASWTRGGNERSLVCGSPNEVANNPLNTNIFVYPYSGAIYDPGDQKSQVWNMIALQSEDQLRQRVAWALSQIIVVTEKQIEEVDYSESFLAYYDIFVRNSFGNYFDILKEVSYSPMMAEMLSYMDSKSSAWVLQSTGSKSYPDENYAREIMQLFSIGLYELNSDGTTKLDNSNTAILSYKNSDIQNFARAWTGFTRQYARSNFELQWWDEDNRIDPMQLVGEYRDPFPKTDLHGGYIGDKVPLCVDLPDKHFLQTGATYRLLGSSPQPLMHTYGWEWHRIQDWYEGPPEEGILFLNSGSNLRSILSSNEPIVTLEATIQCTGNECNMDSLMVVKVQNNPPIYYEYQRRPCVELSFYDNPTKISNTWDLSMCANPKVDAAHDACCSNPDDYDAWGELLCRYDFERTTLSTARSRCQSAFPNGDVCDFKYTGIGDECFTPETKMEGIQDEWYWTGEDCTLRAKINEKGQVAIVHNPNLQTNHPASGHNDRIDLRVHPDNTNYFNVIWDSSNYPKPSNSCASNSCQSVYRGCLCEINISESSVYSSLPSQNQILSQLHIGSIDPTLLASYIQVSNTGNVKVWHKNGGYDKDTVFRVTYRGKDVFLKNARSTVQITDASQYRFRNPPTFLNLGFRETRDAMYETDAVLENYLYHNNVAPFLAIRLIQRLGISNPSPQYVERVATAFKEGTYTNPDTTSGNFGDGRYGNLESTVAAIILDPEGRSVVLDADPTHGSLVEPIIKLTRFMRAMQFETNDTSGSRVRLKNLHQKIGQGSHNAPSVFSFFQPEYMAPGHIKSALITSPEAQILTGPKIISFLNGFISLVDLGLNSCYSGFGEKIEVEEEFSCEKLEYDDNFGRLAYSPSNPNNAVSTVDDLALLLTGGRLSAASKDIISNAYQGEGNNADGLRLAQKLITTTPEFHSSSAFDATTTERSAPENPTGSNERYKAVIFLFLEGGSDSHNMLVPHSGCSGGKTSYNHYASVRGEIAIPKVDLLPIDASSSSQVCSTFGIHPNLPHLKSLYDDGDLLWVANMGVLQQYCTENDWQEKTDKTALFAHNIQTKEVQNMDIYEQEAGRGVGGRMVDVLDKLGFTSTAVSLSGVSDTIVSSLSSAFILDPRTGLQNLNPMSWAQPLWDKVKKLNAFTNLGSNLFGETWSNTLFKAVGEIKFLKGALDSTSLNTAFPQGHELGSQFELVAKLIKSRESRGVDRDVFYVELGGFDTHDNIKEQLDERTTAMNTGIQPFTTEMKAQGVWNDVTIVMVSEFARTLPGNTGAGSDHAWGGNYFIAGGEVEGKQILGSYPNILSEDGSLIFEPGIVVPTMSWDSLWNGVAQWFGITSPEDLDEILPNRNNFLNDLFNQVDLYTTGTPTPPTTPTPPSQTPPTAPSPVVVSTPSPVTADSCEDSPFRFKIVKDGKKIARDCSWVANRATTSRCNLDGVKEQCPLTCGTCSNCVDSPLRFKFEYDGRWITRGCDWVSNRNTISRCNNIDGMEHSCRATCESC